MTFVNGRRKLPFSVGLSQRQCNIFTYTTTVALWRIWQLDIICWDRDILLWNSCINSCQASCFTAISLLLLSAQSPCLSFLQLQNTFHYTLPCFIFEGPLFTVHVLDSWPSCRLYSRYTKRDVSIPVPTTPCRKDGSPLSPHSPLFVSFCWVPVGRLM